MFSGRYFAINRNTENRTVRFGVFEVDLEAGELRKNGIKVKIQEKPFRILSLLLEQPGELVTREELRQKLWTANTFVGFDHSLGTAIGKLRQALGDSAQNARFVETLGNRGYRFVLPVVAVAQTLIIPEPGPIATPPPSLQRLEGALEKNPAGLWRTLLLCALGLGAIAAIWIGLNIRGWRDQLLGRGRASAIRSLAVLPLENLSRDPEQDYFADGMTDELITSLGKIGGIRVISRTSVMAYKGTRKPLAQIARELNVDAVVEGAVLWSGGRVRITAQLIRVNPENHLWAESYERDLRDVLKLQENVARDIAAEISSKLVPPDRNPSRQPRAVDPDVLEAWLKGIFHTTRYTEEEIQRGIRYFNQAIRYDPTYAPAYASLARAYSLLSTYYMAPREVMPQATQAVMKALELDATVAEAHTSLGNIKLFYEWDWPGAEREFKSALVLNPNSADAHDGYANYLVAMGRLDESLAESQQAIELDPLSLVTNADAVGNSLYFSGRFEQAIERGRRTIEFDPNFGLVHFYMAEAFAHTGRFNEALEQAKIGYRLDDSPIMTGLIGEVYAMLGEKAEAAKVLDRLNSLSKRRYVCSYETATIYQCLRDREKALQWLDRAYEERSDCIPWLKVDPAFDGLRADPRFQDLMRRSGLRP